MMRRILLPVLIVCGFVGCQRDPRTSFPHFSILLPDSLTVFNTSRLQAGKPIALVNFESDCRECQMQTDSVLKYMSKFEEVQFVFCSVEKFSNVTLFNRYYKLNNYKNIIVGQDYAKFLPAFAGTHTTPMMLLYNRDRELVAVFEGKAKMSDLSSQIESIQ